MQVDSGSPAKPAEAWESGFKDTVIAFPGDVTRVRVQFSVGARPNGQGVANVYKEYFTGSGLCCVPEPCRLF